MDEQNVLIGSRARRQEVGGFGYAGSDAALAYTISHSGTYYIAVTGPPGMGRYTLQLRNCTGIDTPNASTLSVSNYRTHLSI